jgi:hypothetical protein
MHERAFSRKTTLGVYRTCTFNTQMHTPAFKRSNICFVNADLPLFGVFNGFSLIQINEMLTLKKTVYRVFDVIQIKNR